MPVEVPRSKPFRLEYLFRRRAGEGFQQLAFKLVVRQAVRRSAADIIEVVPERIRDFCLAHIG